MNVSYYRVQSAIYHAHRIHIGAHYDGLRPLEIADVRCTVPNLTYIAAPAELFSEGDWVVTRRHSHGLEILYDPEAVAEHRTCMRVAGASLLGQWLLDGDPLPTESPTSRDDGKLFASCLLCPSWAIEPLLNVHRGAPLATVERAVRDHFLVSEPLARLAVGIQVEHGPRHWQDA